MRVAIPYVSIAIYRILKAHIAILEVFINLIEQLKGPIKID
jgi:hypothetical protein